MKHWREGITDILSRCSVLESEMVELRSAFGRFLAQPLVARFDLPAFDNSAMDGFAIRSSDSGAGAKLRVIGIQPAGYGDPPRVLQRQAVRIMTGGRIPSGADAVIPIEQVLIDGEDIKLLRAVDPGENVRARADEIEEGASLFNAGTELTPARIGIAASFGFASLPVRRMPKIAILPTGDELREVGADSADGAVYNSNAHLLESFVTRDGGKACRFPIVRDQRDELQAAIEKGLGSDLLITTGGVSMGSFDYVPEEFERLGIEIIFHKLAIKPGKPILFGVAKRERPCLIFGLPGNPVSTAVTYEVFVRPALRALLGCPNVEHLQVQARLEERIAKRPELTHFVLGILREERAQLFIRTTGKQGSHRLTSLAPANALLILERDFTEYSAGELVTSLSLNSND